MKRLSRRTTGKLYFVAIVLAASLLDTDWWNPFRSIVLAIGVVAILFGDILIEFLRCKYRTRRGTDKSGPL
ncbi:MAG: hypothetical protein WBN04_14750 [Paracoccaceae bacterium]